jgi:long-chain acyl-CoA synthetase
MLYEIWRKTVRERGNELALRDLSTACEWTFSDLAAEVEAMAPSVEPVAYPRGAEARFLLSVLRAWRDGRIVCPLEPDQISPSIERTFPPEIIHLKTTSATTGPPRLMTFTASQLAADAENIVNTMQLCPDWPNLAVISLAHSYGFSNLVLPLLLHGIPLFLVGSSLPEALRRGSAGLSNITLPAVPALWRSWFEAGAIPPNVRIAISAGAPLPLSLEAAVYNRLGLKIHNFYGSSECGGIAYDRTEQPRSEIAYAGLPLKGVEVCTGDDGCLEVRSRAVATGYWPTPSPELANGVFRTSDLGRVEAGHVYIRGRLSDQINVAGRKVSPESIERVLALHPAVRDCLVFGVPAEECERGETIVACVAVHAETSAETEELKQHLMARLPAWQVPRKWWKVPSLQVNERGKISRLELRKEFQELNS